MIRNTNINYDKIICWEHPNFATKIIKNLDKNLSRLKIKNIPNFLLDDFALIKKGFYIKN